MESMAPVHFILMGSTRMVDNKYIKYCFDLKGSIKNREKKDFSKNASALLDRNFTAFSEADKFMLFRQEDREKILMNMA